MSWIWHMKNLGRCYIDCDLPWQWQMVFKINATFGLCNMNKCNAFYMIGYIWLCRLKTIQGAEGCRPLFSDNSKACQVNFICIAHESHSVSQRASQTHNSTGFWPGLSRKNSYNNNKYTSPRDACWFMPSIDVNSVQVNKLLFLRTRLEGYQGHWGNFTTLLLKGWKSEGRLGYSWIFFFFQQ